MQIENRINIYYFFNIKLNIFINQLKNNNSIFAL